MLTGQANLDSYSLKPLFTEIHHYLRIKIWNLRDLAEVRKFQARKSRKIFGL